MKKGFTIIQLIFVIIILCIICFISFPMIKSFVDGSKINIFRSNVEKIIDVINKDSQENDLVISRKYLYRDKTLTLVKIGNKEEIRTLNTNIDMLNGSGEIEYNSIGKLYLYINDKSYCAYKDFDGEIFFGKLDECKELIK